MTARQVELKRLASEAREMANRWGGLAASLIVLRDARRPRCQAESAAVRIRQANAVTSASARLQDSVDFLVRIKLLAAKERR